MKENNVLLRLSKRLYRKNLPYVVLKGSYDLGDVFNGMEDLDLLILPEKVNALENELLDFGFVYLESVPLFQENFTKDYFYYCSDINAYYHVHLHTQVTFGNSVMPNRNLALERLFIERRTMSSTFNLFILPPELDLFFLNERKSISDGKLWYRNTHYREYLLELCKNYNPSAVSYLEDVFDLDFKESIDLFFSSYTTSPHKSSLKVRKYAFRIRPCFSLKYLLRALNKIILKLFRFNISGRRRIPFRGKAYVIVGMDGSGKSSSIKHISGELNKMVDTEVITLGSGKSGAAFYRRIIFFVFGNRAFSKSHRAVRGKGSTQPKKISLIYSLWIMLCLFDKWANLKKLKRGVLSGKICLVDRWPQDIDIEFSDSPRMLNIANQSILNIRLINFEQKIMAEIKKFSPDKIIVLNINPEVSLIRKPNELTLNQACVAFDKFNSFDWERIAPFELVDANKDHVHVLECISRILWRDLSE